VRKHKYDTRVHYYIVCGILMHCSLAVTTEGLPLGLAAIKFWTRDEFKGCNALKKNAGPIERKESYRWLENVRQSTALFDAFDNLIWPTCDHLIWPTPGS